MHEEMIKNSEDFYKMVFFIAVNLPTTFRLKIPWSSLFQLSSGLHLFRQYITVVEISIDTYQRHNVNCLLISLSD